jgi:translation initiation factor IF-2
LPVRIYALAKQLKFENKVLVDLCKTLGIQGKGSALASLSDEEVALIREHLSGGKKTASTAAGRGLATKQGAAATDAESALRREDYIPPGGSASKKVPVLAGKAKPSAPAKPAAELKPPEDKASPKEAPKPAEPPISPKTPEKAATKPPPKPQEDKGGPSIKLAPMPTAKQPKQPKAQEPAPQKPDIKLPPDAIRAGKAGTKPLAEHLRKQEEKRKGAAEKKTPAKEAAEKTRGEPGFAPAQPKERGRRGARRAEGTEDDVGKLGGREQRQLRRKRAASERRRRAEEDDGSPAPAPQPRRLKRTGTASTAAPRKHDVIVEIPCALRAFAESLGLPVQRVLGKSFELGLMLNINTTLDLETAELLAEALEVRADFRRQLDLEEKLIVTAEHVEDPPESLQPRPPVVTFLGHVDHGKTSLLDRILRSDVVASEKGGITQHIRAYRIEKDGRPIAFVDTPGHEAFTAMRARGAHCTDIAVLVVAADDGVMPQTEEAISHAKAAGVPIVVALNKIDLPGVNIDRVLQELAAAELLPSDWGGDTEVVRTSATTGEGIDELLETLLTVAELHEYQANPDRAATGICLEAEVQPGRGVVAKLLVQKGTLHVGDIIVCGAGHGRVKAMYDTLNPRKRHKQIGPSTPVNLIGLDVAPGAGDRFHVLESIPEARQIAERRAERTREEELAGVQSHVTLENLFERLGEKDEVQTLNIVLRADVRGSIEAIRKELTKLEHPEVQVHVLQATVGGITEADVYLADASDAVIIGFNVVPDEGARSLADETGVQIRRYDIIYEVTEDLKAALEGMLKPEERELDLGRALVQRTFHISRVGTVAGCRVLAGNIPRDARIRVIRESRVIGDYPLDSLKREKDDAKEVREGLECGMKLRGFDDVKEGDVLEAYKIEEVARTF